VWRTAPAHTVRAGIERQALSQPLDARPDDDERAGPSLGCYQAKKKPL
jgi:hypothetical protein